MTILSQAAPSAEREEDLRAQGARGNHSPSAGATARLIHDLRELFKVRVVGLVLVTGWGGFYLGSLQSGIPTLQRGLVDTLAGDWAGLSRSRRAEPGAGAHDRRADEAHRGPAAGFRALSAGVGIAAGLGATALGSWWLLVHTNLLTVALALLTAFTYVAIYTPLKRVTTLATFIGAFPGAMGPLLGWTAARGGMEWQAVALFAILFVWQFPHFMAIAWMYREEYAQRRHSHAAGGAAGRLVHGGRSALLRSRDDPGEPGAVAAGRGQPASTPCPPLRWERCTLATRFVLRGFCG